MSLPSHAYPGLSLGSSAKFLAGPGTHLSNNSIVASIAGAPTLIPALPNTQPYLPTVSISRKPQTARTPTSRAIVSSNTLPIVGSTVLARVNRLEKARATVSILVVDNENTVSLSDAYTKAQTPTSTQSHGANTQGNVNADGLAAVIRREDIRGWEIDKVSVPDMFRVGDIVRAVMISIGDQQAYYLSTARNELGVLMARSEDGNVMFPVSWKEFRDPATGRAEGRKVAKPV